MSHDLERMASRFQFPHLDGTGRWVGEGAGFVIHFQCLSPESLLEGQPVCREGALLMLDGQIDHREALSDRLGLKNGCDYSDARLCLLAFEKWGADCAKWLSGDFTLAIWQPALRRLHLFNDGFASRPLYYAAFAGGFAFASVPRALFALKEFSRAVDRNSLLHFLSTRPLPVGSSFYQGIQTLPPGHHLLCSDGQIRLSPHWDPHCLPRLSFTSESQCHEAFLELFQRAVRSKLRARGKVGLLLSGGLDSGSVAALASAQLALKDQELPAFCSVPPPGFSQQAPRGRYFDERELVSRLAARYPNLRPHFVVADCQPGWPGDEGLKWFDHAEMPLVCVFNRAMHLSLLDAAQEQGVEVLMHATAGNLTFSWTGVRRLEELARSGDWLGYLSELSSYLTQSGFGTLKTSVLYGVIPLLPSWVHPAIKRIQGRGKGQKKPLLPEVRQAFLKASPQLPASDGLAERIRVFRNNDQAHYAFMGGGHGIEMRDPTKDRALVEFCFGLPTASFFARGVPRRLAREGMREWLPVEILQNRKKGLQMGDWFELLKKNQATAARLLEAIKGNAEAENLLDLERLQFLLNRFPSQDWKDLQTLKKYRLNLGRGLHVGAFLLWVASESRKERALWD